MIIIVGQLTNINRGKCDKHFWSFQKIAKRAPKNRAECLSFLLGYSKYFKNKTKTRQSKQCGFSIYVFDNSKSKSMVRLVRSEKMALSGLVFARKIARMILIQNV